MADVTLTYKGATIGELSETGNKTLKTAGKYCEADILLEYVKSSGGLPSSIKKIDGGDFTYSENQASTVKIPHTLGEIPKGFVIWTDDLDLSTAGNSAVVSGTFIRNLSQSSSLAYLYQMNVYSGNFNGYARNLGTNYSGYANENNISFNIGNSFYVAGIQYHWFAWA